MIVALWLALLAQVEAPRTVNGQSLGTVEEYRDAGPARICLDGLTIDIVEGETATLQYAGIHSLTVRVTQGDQFIDVALGDAWAKRRRGKVVLGIGGAEYRRTGGGKIGYTLFSRTNHSDGRLAPVAMISGPGLSDDADELASLGRVRATQNLQGCTRRYNYGWDMLFGDEPVSLRPTQ